MANIDNDGFEDNFSVCEIDEKYGPASVIPGLSPPAEGHARIAFGCDNPDQWFSININSAESSDAPAPEDAVIVYLNPGGYLDVVAAAEQSHLYYLQNNISEIFARITFSQFLSFRCPHSW